MMIRQAAFEGKREMLKGALHCHTTRSDGDGDPGDVMRLHKENGYDFIALTDHRRYNYESFAPETGLTVIPGMELDANFPRKGGVHCIHTVSIGPEKEKGNGFEHDQRFQTVSIEKPSDYQPVLDYLHENGNLTIYCHPEWSNTPISEFKDLEGNFAMELWNSGCAIENELDVDNGFIWDQVNQHGNRLWGVAVDDGHAMNQHCRGWVMVNAVNDVSAILDALRRGAFYASTGPEIYDFRIEDDMAYVECSPCANIIFRTGLRPLRLQRNGDGFITSAATKVLDYFPFVRAVVTDEKGMKAWTNPIFLD